MLSSRIPSSMELKQNDTITTDDKNAFDGKKEKESETDGTGGDGGVSKERKYFPFWYLILKTVVAVTSWTAIVSRYNYNITPKNTPS